MTIIICLIDDDSMNLSSLQMLVEELGYSVCIFNSADAFFRYTAKENINACITDCFLGEANGIDVISYLSRAHPQIASVLMSATLTQEIRTEAYKCGATSVVSKPVPVEFLSKFLDDLR